MKVIFAGTPDFAVLPLRALLASSHEVLSVLTQPDRPAGRGRKLSASAVKQCALAADVAVLQPVSLKNADIQLRLAQYRADVMVVVAYGLILPTQVLSIPKYGCLNIHASLLPRWRGAAPIQRAIMAGDKQSGITIMQMDKGLDTGAVLYMQKTAITPADNGQTLHDRLSQMGAKALLHTLSELEQGRLVAHQQDDSQACYADKINKAEAFIDWSDTAQNIVNKTKAFNPWPVAQTRLDNKLYRIWEAEILIEEGKNDPGTIIALSKNGLDVASADGIVRIKTLQLPGKKALSVADFANAKPAIKLGIDQFS